MGKPAEWWPKLQEYQAAIKAESNFRDERLHGFHVQRHPALRFDAWGRPGSFGVVYKIESETVAYAVKVFYQPQPDRQLRYRLIDQHLRSIPMPRQLVSFVYDEAGIRVNGRDYPTLRMDWADGDSLDIYLDRLFTESAPVDNATLSAEWVATLQELHNSTIAHGDLQHKNILVQSNANFRLVDYDGVFVPAMRQHGLAACEAGVSSYQHPKRKNEIGHFHERIDDFSALVILLTLACVDADLWERYHEDGRLLFSEADLLCPRESALLTELSGRNGAVGTLASLVRTTAGQDLDQVPPFGRVVTELGMKWSERGERLAVPGQPPGTTGFPGAAAADPQPQTYAQRQIAGLHAAGRSVDEIVSALGLSRATVEDYVKVLERKTTGQKFVWPPSASFSAPSRPPAQVTPAPPQVTPAPPQVTPAPAQVTPPGQQQALSPRQQEVLELLRAGLQPAQIAARLQLQLATVNRHLSSIRAVAGEDEVRKLLDQAAAKLAAARPDAPAQAGTASITPWWIAAAPPASEPQTAMKPVAGRPLPVRPGPTPRPPSSPPGGTVPAPRRARRRSTASVVLWLLILLVIIVAIGAIV